MISLYILNLHNVFLYMYNWITLLYTWNMLNQLYVNKKMEKKTQTDVDQDF